MQIRSEVFPMPDPWKGEEISPASRGRNGGSGDELWGPCAGVSGGSGDCCPDVDPKRGSLASGRGEHVLDYMLRLSDELDRCGRFGTARNYRRTAGSFSRFLGRDIPFSRLDERLICAYAEWLRRRNLVRNTVSFYMRVLRAVYNKAVKQRIVEQRFPFRSVYTGVDRTRKRALDERTVISLQRLDLGHDPSLALARDLFVFSYCMRGMAFVDIAFLRRDAIRNGVIAYCRHKTGQCLEVRMEPCIERIVRRYEGDCPSGPYVFPLIRSSEPGAAFREYYNALSVHNRKLKELSKLVDAGISLTSYVARHTWATVARKHRIPLAVISAGMGHTSEKTTQIYLDSLDNSVVDRANRRIIQALNL
ncbi:site-specific integrase [uncultured Alistipes sp.]|uniref:tyrosine-type recombinase/integrase n=1 Tax=uncultured Alistipes sp. TaxID=538949 RepID=UPI0032B11D3E